MGSVVALLAVVKAAFLVLLLAGVAVAFPADLAGGAARSVAGVVVAVVGLGRAAGYVAQLFGEVPVHRGEVRHGRHAAVGVVGESGQVACVVCARGRKGVVVGDDVFPGQDVTSPARVCEQFPQLLRIVQVGSGKALHLVRDSFFHGAHAEPARRIPEIRGIIRLLMSRSHFWGRNAGRKINIRKKIFDEILLVRTIQKNASKVYAVCFFSCKLIFFIAKVVT